MEYVYGIYLDDGNSTSLILLTPLYQKLNEAQRVKERMEKDETNPKNWSYEIRKVALIK